MINFFKDKDKNFIELLKGSSISLIVRLMGMAFGYLAMIFITTNYGAEEWGIYSLCFTILSITILLPKFGFDNSLVRIITELNTFNDKKQIITVVFKSLIISAALSLVVIFAINAFSEVLAKDILNQKQIEPYLMIVGYAIFPMTVLVIISAIFQALKKPMLFMLFQTTLINIVFFVLLVIFHWQEMEFNIFKLYLYSISITLFFGALLVMFTLWKKQSTLTLRKNIYGYRKIVNISIPMLLSSSFALLMGWSDILMLSFFKTTKDIGIYNSSLKLAALSGITLIAINAIATPKFVEFYSKNDIEGLKETVKKSTKMIFSLTTPVLFVLIVFSKKILLFLGDEFVVGYLALVYLCISRFINAISGSVGYIMQMTDQQKTYQNVIIIAFLINLALNFILIPEYSYNGAAIASSVAMIFWNVTLVFLIKKRLGFWTIYIPFLFK